MTPTREVRPSETPTLDEISLEELEPADGVHDASTTVAELPAELLEWLKSPALRSTAATPPPPPRPSVGAPSVEVLAESELAIVDLASLLDADEPVTLQLETAVLGVPKAPAPQRGSRPVEIHFHVPGPGGTLAIVQSEMAQLPRSWKIAGTCVAAFVIAAAFFTLVSRVAN